GQLELSRQERLPMVYGDVNLQLNVIVTTTPVLAMPFDLDAAEGVIIPPNFSSKWSAKVGLQAEWQIFHPKQRLDEKERDLHQQKAIMEKDSHAQNWRRDATLAYASVVLATHQYERARQDSALYAEILALVQSRFEAGRESSMSYIESQQE